MRTVNYFVSVNQKAMLKAKYFSSFGNHSRFITRAADIILQMETLKPIKCVWNLIMQLHLECIQPPALNERM